MEQSKQLAMERAHSTDVAPQVLVVMGATGAGKTTVGQRLADELGWTFIDSDDLHPKQNVEKMSRGISLTDADRAPWLTRVRAFIENCLDTGQHAVVACSALRHSYREQLRAEPRRVRFVYLKGSYPLLRERLHRRTGHFMKPSMLHSQLAALEEPRSALVIDAALPVDAVVAQVREVLRI